MFLFESFSKYKINSHKANKNGCFIDEIFLIEQNNLIESGLNILTDEDNNLIKVKINNKNSYIGYKRGSGLFKYKISETESAFFDFKIENRKFTLEKQKNINFCDKIYFKEALKYENTEEINYDDNKINTKSKINNKTDLIVNKLNSKTDLIEAKLIESSGNSYKYEQEISNYLVQTFYNKTFEFKNFVIQSENLEFLYFYLFFTPFDEIFVFSTTFCSTSVNLLILDFYRANNLKKLLELEKNNAIFHYKYNLNNITKNRLSLSENLNILNNTIRNRLTLTQNLSMRSNFVIKPNCLLNIFKLFLLEKQLLIISKNIDTLFNLAIFIIKGCTPFSYQFYIKSFCGLSDEDILEMPFPFLICSTETPKKIPKNCAVFDFDKKAFLGQNFKKTSITKKLPIFPFEETLKDYFLTRNKMVSMRDYIRILMNNIDITRERQLMNLLNNNSSSGIRLISEYPDKFIDFSLKKEKEFYLIFSKTQIFKTYCYNSSPNFFEVEYNIGDTETTKKLKDSDDELLQFCIFFRVFPVSTKRVIKLEKEEHLEFYNNEIFLFYCLKSLSFNGNLVEIIDFYKKLIKLKSRITPTVFKSINIQNIEKKEVLDEPKAFKDSENIVKKNNKLVFEEKEYELLKLDDLFIKLFLEEENVFIKKYYVNILYHLKKLISNFN